MKPCALYFSFLVISIPQADAASFMGLGGYGVGPNSQTLSAARSVSGDGQVVVGYSALPTGGQTAVYWDASGQIHSIAVSTSPSDARGTSGDGSVIVGGGDFTSGLEAFMWDSSVGLTGLGTFGGQWSEAYDVSQNGTQVAGTVSWRNTSSGPINYEAFLWTDSAVTRLGDLPGGDFFSEARGVSGDGSIAVGFSRSFSGMEAFRWTQDTGMQGLGTLFGESRAEAISADGTTIVGYSRQNGRELAFIHTVTGGMISLGGLGDSPLSVSNAYDVSADGHVVVGTGSPGNGLDAFIWTSDQGMRNLQDVLTLDYGLDLTGWDLEDAFSVSDDGRVIVGGGWNPQGNYEAFVANLTEVPVPASAMLFGSGLLSLIGLSRRRSGATRDRCERKPGGKEGLVSS